MLRQVVHLDADAFFASVEQAADPRLRGLPVAVGGEQRGIIASASYEARKFGIYTPMPTVRARKLCPKLILLPGDFEKYERFSRWMFSYAYDFTPDVEITSIDEGYFDLTSARKPAVEVAQTIRRAIGESLKISVSEGIGTNKLISQIASKLNKPSAFASVPAGGEGRFLWPLPNRWLPGVGPKTAACLDAAGLVRIGQVAETPVDLLGLLVGSAAPQLRRFAHGVDERPIVPVSEPAKSYSRQETFAVDQTDEAYLEAVLRGMADQLMAKVRADGKSVRTVTVKVRYNDMAEDQCSESLREPTDLETDLYGRLGVMLQQAWRRRVSLRLVSLKFSNLYDGWFRVELPLERAAQVQEARRRLAGVVDELRRERGREVVLRGHDFMLREAKAEYRVARGRLPEKGDKLQEGRDKLQGGGGKGQGGGGKLQEGGGKGQGPGVPGSELRGLNPEPGMSGSGLRLPRVPRRARSELCPVPLVARSYYSFLDSTLSVEALVRLAVERGQSAVALCDTGNLHGVVEFVQRARAAGIHPVVGAEVRVGGRPVRLLVENRQGYGNLCRILSAQSGGEACWDGSRGGPELSTDGLIAVGGDPGLARWFPGRFYLGVESAEEWRRRWEGRTELPGVAAGPVHYAVPADRWKFNVVQSIRTLTLLDQAHPGKRLEGDWHYPRVGELAGRFDGAPRLLERTVELAERCRWEFPFGPPQFPAFVPPGGESSRDYLRRLVFAGLAERYGARAAAMRGQVEEELSIIHEVGYEDYFLLTWDLLQECRRRGIEWITRGSAADSLVCYCLGISGVCPVRFDLYFRRFLNKERMALNKLPDIDVDFPHDRKDDVVDLIFGKYGAGHCAVVGGFSTFLARGAVGEVGKVLGVSEYQIRRFTEHFPWSWRGDLLEILRESPECRDLPVNEEPYRSAIRMAAFLDGFPRYAKMHPCGVVLSRQPMHELTPTFTSAKGYATTHLDMEAVEAVGLVKMDILAQGGLAVMRDAKRALAVRGIEVDLERCRIVRGDDGRCERAAARVAPDAPGDPRPARRAGEPWNDPAVWAMIASGGARAVHHIESPAMVGLCRMTQVREIDGLVAIVSVIRPGAANEQKKLRFTRRYQGMEPVSFPDASLAACLRSTFGLVVYEEHILQICEAFAGLSAGRADVLRRGLVKELAEVVESVRPEFVASARARGHGEERIAEVWELVTGFSGYAFCRAHSTAYGVEAYQAAWLKRYFPGEFMAAVLTHGKGFYHPLVYVLECHRLGIPLRPPWVNQPGPDFEMTEVQGAMAKSLETGSKKGDGKLQEGRGKLAEGGGKGQESRTGDPDPNPKGQGVKDKGQGMGVDASPVGIRVPVRCVKGMTDRTLERVVSERARGEFVSLTDFYRRTGALAEEMEALIRVGAFDGFGRTRTEQFWEYQLERQGEDPGVRQGWLFDPPAEAVRAWCGQGGRLEEPTRARRLAWEAELLGYPVSGHPLELHEGIAWESYCPVTRLGEFVGREVTMCGLVIEQRVHHQANGEPMKFLTLADWTGMVETELFAPTYRSYGLATVRYPVLEITGKVESFENGRGFTLRVLRAGRPRQARREG